MPNIAFFVDGLTEQLFLDRICRGYTIRRIGLNGNTVSLDAIVKRVSANIIELNNRNYPIIIIIDREKRAETWEQIKDYLECRLRSLFQNLEIMVFVCDIMIENWMLFDTENLIAYIEECSPPELDTINGRSGKKIMKALKKDYHETTDGVSLLFNMRPSIVRLHCPSFNCLFEALSGLECSWLSK